jgi:hypothetical protein
MSSSGVQIMGIRWPSFSHTTAILRAICALAKCLQFHADPLGGHREPARCKEASAPWAAKTSASNRLVAVADGFEGQARHYLEATEIGTLLAFELRNDQA